MSLLSSATSLATACCRLTAHGSPAPTATTLSGSLSSCSRQANACGPRPLRLILQLDGLGSCAGDLLSRPHEGASQNPLVREERRGRTSALLATQRALFRLSISFNALFSGGLPGFSLYCVLTFESSASESNRKIAKIRDLIQPYLR